MADDTGKPLDSNTNDQPDPSNEIMPVQHTEPIKPIQQTENMEVHHPQHVTHKKKWTEYLLEFFMLFLAVFLGFVAENIRENSIERHREEEYIKSMVQNLKDDTAKLNVIIPQLILRIQRLDSLTRLSKADLTTPENLKTINRLGWYQSNYNYFKNNNATIAQLKSGNLRLIQKKNAADSILKYDLINSGTELQWQLLYGRASDFIASSEEVFDLVFMFDTSNIKNGVVKGFPPPLSNDKKALKIYFNKAVAYLVTSRGYRRALEAQAKYANQLLKFLQNEYHLEKK